MARSARSSVGPRPLIVARSSRARPAAKSRQATHNPSPLSPLLPPAALIAARDSLCANSMALGGRAGNYSCKRGGVANRLVQTHDICVLSKLILTKTNSPHSRNFSSLVYHLDSDLQKIMTAMFISVQCNLCKCQANVHDFDFQVHNRANAHRENQSVQILPVFAKPYEIFVAE